ncbi:MULTISPECIES: hypothetical protein [unclassified Sphingomonas]|uniref:hypothetical protein n=1 Tax=unclassified Sphingomonas TaxID=196159 RepID=UPI000AF1C30D|nr:MULTISPECIES: hypothetical protein [unclassified Sphingomonas]
MKRNALALVALAALVFSIPAIAGNSLIAPGERKKVAKSDLSITPTTEWNRLDERPGRRAETWTLDGDALNDVTFYGGIEPDRPLFAEVDKRNQPLPRVSATMLITDIPLLFETSYRVAFGTSLMTIDSVEPAVFAGHKGVRFTYSFVRQDEDVHRRGEARAAMIEGALYMITYEAPTLHYFDRSLAAFRQLADSARF